MATGRGPGGTAARDPLTNVPYLADGNRVPHRASHEARQVVGPARAMVRGGTGNWGGGVDAARDIRNGSCGSAEEQMQLQLRDLRDSRMHGHGVANQGASSCAVDGMHTCCRLLVAHGRGALRNGAVGRGQHPAFR